MYVCMHLNFMSRVGAYDIRSVYLIMFTFITELEGFKGKAKEMQTYSGRDYV